MFIDAFTVPPTGSAWLIWGSWLPLGFWPLAHARYYKLANTVHTVYKAQGTHAIYT
jgi:hypothetical protein